jgi:glycerol-3-phosphate dehydrogenase
MDNASQPPIVQGSSGIHITLPLYFGSQTMGMLDPQTSDGRVVFMLPWEGVLLVGTTDTPCPIEANPVRGQTCFALLLSFANTHTCIYMYMHMCTY